MAALISDYSSIFNIKRLTLVVEKLATITTIPLTTLDLVIDTDRDAFVDYELANMYLRLCARLPVYYDVITAYHNAKEYSSPWQHFKHLYLPNWFITKFPIVYKWRKEEVKVVVKEIFPHLAYLAKDGNRYIDVAYTE